MIPLSRRRRTWRTPSEPLCSCQRSILPPTHAQKGETRGVKGQAKVVKGPYRHAAHRLTAALLLSPRGRVRVPSTPRCCCCCEERERERRAPSRTDAHAGSVGPRWRCRSFEDAAAHVTVDTLRTMLTKALRDLHGEVRWLACCLAQPREASSRATRAARCSHRRGPPDLSRPAGRLPRGVQVCHVLWPSRLCRHPLCTLILFLAVVRACVCVCVCVCVRVCAGGLAVATSSCALLSPA
jgi:hypothetical protein